MQMPLIAAAAFFIAIPSLAGPAAAEPAPDLATFFALRTGPATQWDGTPATLRTVEAGDLAVPSGVLSLSNPFVGLEDGSRIPIPAGTYPVVLTIAETSTDPAKSDERNAYLSVVLNLNPPSLLVRDP